MSVTLSSILGHLNHILLKQYVFRLWLLCESGIHLPPFHLEPGVPVVRAKFDTNYVQMFG